MKKTVSAILIITVLCGAMLALASCKKDDGAPDKMQLVRGGESLGYYFYGPEEWVVANHGDIACTYVSSVDFSSCTFVETHMPVTESAGATRLELIAEYFTKEEAKFPFEIKVDAEASGKKTAFGDADEAYQYVYTYTYDELPYTCMQIFIFEGERFYIFTYTSSSKEYSKEEGSYYQFYLKNKVIPIIENFKFVDKKESDKTEDEYERDEEGYMLVSDKKISGFKLYITDNYKVDYSSSFVSVSKEDGTNINVSRLINSTVSIEENYKNRKEELSALSDRKTVDGEEVSSFREIKASDNIIELENARAGAEYEYTYTLLGTEYHVYQVFIVDGYLNAQVYVFTFTAQEANYESNIEEAKAILHKMDY